MTTTIPQPTPLLSRQRRRRLLLLAVVCIVVAVWGHRAGWHGRFSVRGIRAAVAEAGAWGMLLYLAAFSIRDLLRVPGAVFCGAAVLAYGRLEGGVLAYVGVNMSVIVSFVGFRMIGGQALGEIDRPRIRRILAHLDEHPIRTVFLLRHILVSTTVMNCTMALSNIRFRDYLIGSLTGLIAPTILTVLLWDWLLG